MRRTRLMWFGVFAAVTSVAAGLTCWLTPLSTSVTDRRFEREGWLHGSPRERGSMARDLEASGRLLGLRPGDVEELLGPPDYRHSVALTYIVDLGYRWGSTPWTYALNVELSGDAQQVIQVNLRD